MSLVNFPDLKPKVVLGVAAHPDDLDFEAGGTMAKFASQGAKVYYLIVTDGDKGTDDQSLSPTTLAKIREKEQRAALKLLGGIDIKFLHYPDCGIEVSMDLKKDIVNEMRRLKPNVVVTMDPSILYSSAQGTINHPDHRATGQATIDAVYPLARDHLSFPELFAAGLEPHKAETLLLINFDSPNYFVDISETIELKWQAVKTHQTQVKNFKHVKDFYSRFAKEFGRRAGCDYAESFVRLDITQI